jgi:hypothetical protein
MNSTARKAAAVGAQTAYDIGAEGYTFPYPITVMNLPRRPMSGVVAAGQVIGCGPADDFVNVLVSPAELRDAVRPDIGTLCPVARFDLRDEPRIVFVLPAGSCLRPVEWR